MPRYPSTTQTLFIIGGAEDRVGRASLLRRFVRITGGRQARLVVIPTASSFQDEVVTSYTEVFNRFGVQTIGVVNPQSRQDAQDEAAVALIDDATGIFMSGGSQLRLSQYFPGTPVGDALHRAHARGAVVAGTSAGASIMSEFMISMGDEGITPVQRASQISAGWACSRESSSTSTSPSARATVGSCPSSRRHRACSASASTRTPRSRWSTVPGSPSTVAGA